MVLGESRILVTGGGGFVGTWLLARLRDEPSRPIVHAVGLDHGPSIAGGLDITDEAAMNDVIRTFRPTCVIHLAAISSLQEARVEGRRAWQVNVFGTLNIAEAILRHVPDARLLFASSSEVYGGSFQTTSGPLDETALLDPRNPYALTKAAADLALGQMAEAGLRAVRMRLFNHTGPGQSARFAIPAFAAQIAAIERGLKPPVLSVGNLDARRDFLDVRDAVSAYLRAVVAKDLPHGLVLNIASGTARRIGDALDGLLSMARCFIRVEPDAALTRPSDLPVTAGDAQRARDLLEWQPEVPWETTLRDVLESARDQG